MTFVRTLPAIGGLAAVAVVSAATPALAEPLVHERFHESSSEVVEEFCGDLTVREDIDFTGTFVGNPHGPDELFYGLEHLHGTHSWTNLANGKTFTVVVNVLNKDQRVTDNGHRVIRRPGLRTTVDPPAQWTSRSATRMRTCQRHRRIRELADTLSGLDGPDLLCGGNGADRGS